MTDHLQIAVPTFDGKRNSFLNYEEKVLIWRNISPLPPDQKASHLLLHMSDVARKVCLTVGKDVVGNMDGVEAILKILRNRFAPDKIDCIFRILISFRTLRERPRTWIPTCWNSKCCANEQRHDSIWEQGSRMNSCQSSVSRTRPYPKRKSNWSSQVLVRR